MTFEILPTLFAGVISGFITTLLILIGVKYWKSIIVPWYEEKVYKDIKIVGKWDISAVENGDTFNELAKVKQKAHRVWGEIIYKTKTEFTEYQFEGEFKNLILTARYWVKEENSLDRGTFTLMLKSDGKILEGRYAWYQGEHDDVVSGSYEWTRRQ